MIKSIFGTLIAFCFSVSVLAQQGLDPHEITQAEAVKLTGAFQTASSKWNVHAGTIPKQSVEWLMNRTDAASLTYYWGMDEQNELQAIYVATKSDGTEILETDAILCPRRITMHSAMSASNILTVEQAVTMMKRYRNSALFSQYQGKLGATIAKSSILRLVQQSGCAGLRSYFGLTNSGTPVLVFVSTTGTADDMNALFDDRGANCPPDCKEPPPLLIQLSSQN